MRIHLEHVRSFATRQEIPIRPLTLLVGENSSGKSTFLAVVAAVLDRARFPLNPGFNLPPYNLGTFDTIATYKGGKYGRDASFSIGYSHNSLGSKEYGEVIATYRSEAGNVRCDRARVVSPRGKLTFRFTKGPIRVAMEHPIRKGSRSQTSRFEVTIPGSSSRGHGWAFPLRSIIGEIEVAFARPRGVASKTCEEMWKILYETDSPYRGCYSYAPIRSKPRRTYDELSEEYSPEGDHIPTLLARLLRQERTSVESRRVQEALRRFGAESGLFKTIDVKRLGKKVTDPFQLQVKVGGPAVSLTDVGYGVSQALPILVQSVLKSTSDVLLMQQPEVHLHPRAQAALGTFFAGLVADGKRIALIETHSDHLVDRVRQEVATGAIAAKDVQILFFHKPKLDTKVWPLTLDKAGNIVDAPAAYRKFFLEEETNLFERTS